MRRKRLPGTRKPLSCPLSKQRMMVCWLTLQILAASPVVNTVFMRTPSLAGGRPAHEWGLPGPPGAGPETLVLHDSPLAYPSERRPAVDDRGVRGETRGSSSARSLRDGAETRGKGLPGFPLTAIIATLGSVSTRIAHPTLL